MFPFLLDRLDAILLAHSFPFSCRIIRWNRKSYMVNDKSTGFRSFPSKKQAETKILHNRNTTIHHFHLWTFQIHGNGSSLNHLFGVSSASAFQGLLGNLCVRNSRGRKNGRRKGGEERRRGGGMRNVSRATSLAGLLNSRNLNTTCWGLFSRLVVGPEKSAERVATPSKGSNIFFIKRGYQPTNLPAQSFAPFGRWPATWRGPKNLSPSLSLSHPLSPSLFSPIFSIWLYGLVWLTIAVSILVPIHRIVKQCAADYSI